MASQVQKIAPPTAGRRWLAPAVLAVLVLGSAAFGVRLALRRSAVAAALPPRPPAGALPSEFENQVDDAERTAHSLLHSVAGLEALARIYHANGFYDEALRCYGGLRQLEPRDARWPHMEASILAQFGRQDEALPREEAAVERAPGYVPARLRLGDEYLIANRTAEAVATYQAVLDRSPGNPYALLGLATCAVAQGDWARARDDLNQSIRGHPDFVGGLSLLVTVDEHFGDQDGADALKRTIGNREFVDVTDPWLYGLMDDCYDSYRLSVQAAVVLAAGDEATAKSLLERAIAFAPNASEYPRQLARIESSDGDYAAARQHLERSVAINPRDHDAWIDLHAALKKLGEDGAAEQAVASGLANCPDSYGLHLQYGIQLNAAGSREAALAEYREAHRLNPGETGPLSEEAGVLFALKRDDQALAALHEALDRQPQSALPLATLTFYYINQGDEPTALAWWAKVRRQVLMPDATIEALKSAYKAKFGRDLN